VISEEQAKALEKVVGDFRWDHDEGYRDDEEGGFGNPYECDCNHGSGSWLENVGRLSTAWGGHHTEWEPEW